MNLRSVIIIAFLLLTTGHWTGMILTAQVIANDDSAAHFLSQSLTAKEQGRRLDHIHLLNKAISFQPQDPVTLRKLGDLLAEQRKYAGALELLTKAIERNPQDSGLLTQALSLAYQLRQFEEVIRLSELLLKIDTDAAVSIYLGKAYYAKEDYGKAIQYLTQAQKENPTMAEIPYLIAKSYADMSNFKLSVPFFLKSLELDPAQPGRTYELGLTYYAIQDDINALKYILRAAEVGYKKDNDYLENLGMAYLNVGQFDQGVIILKEALGKRPSDINLLSMLAEAHYNKAKFPEAIEYWDRVLEFDKTHAISLYMIGMSYQKIGGKANTEKGIALCDKAIEMDPSLSNLKQKKIAAGL